MLAIQPMIFEDDKYNELWKPLVFEGIDDGEYLISTHGNIYDLKKNHYVSKRVSNTNGYVYISLRHNDKLKSGVLLLHRVMAANFVVYKRHDQIQVNHKNGVKTCNDRTNLEWSTPKENTNHAFETGLAANNIGERSHLAKLTNEEVELICQYLMEGISYKEILTRMNIEVSPNAMDMIGNIYRKIAWRHISDKYKFPNHDPRFKFIFKSTVEQICRLIEQGMSNDEIYYSIYGISYDAKNKSTYNDYNRINNIRNKIEFQDISANYNFP